MAIKDLFVPRWEHSKPGRRLASIEEVGNNPALLARMATTDNAPEVRCAAIKKIEDETVLAAIIKDERDEAVRKAAVDKRDLIHEKILATSTDPDAIMRILENRGGEKAITAFLCDHARNIDTQRIFVAKISTPHLLCKVAEHECALETGEHIVGVLSDKEHLERLAHKASNKKIRILAGKKLESLQADPLALQHANDKTLEQCVASMDVKVGLANVEQAEAVLEMARSVWGRYDPDRTHPAAGRFATAETELSGRIHACAALQETVRTLISLADQSEAVVREPLEVAAPAYAELSGQWNGIDKTGLSGAGYESAVRRFTVAGEVLEKERVRAGENEAAIRRNAGAVNACCDELERLVQSDDPAVSKRYDAILARWRMVSSADHGTPSSVERFVRLQQQYAEKMAAISAQKLNAVKQEEELVERMVLRMESAAQGSIEQAGVLSREIAELKRAWERRYPLAQEHKDSLEPRFKSAHEQFMVNLFEFKDQNQWKQWAVGNVGTKICAEIEQFEERLKQGEFPVGLMRKVQAFQSEWTRGVGRDRTQTPELNERFTSACNRIFALGCAKKADLLEQLKQIVSPEAGRDTVDAVKQIQQQWNEIGYLPLDMEKEIADAFHSTSNTFFEQRRESHQNFVAELQKNGAIREELCKEAEALAGSTEWKETIASFGNLQVKWEASSPAPVKRSRELWEMFNAFRDRFFEQYETHKQANVAIKEALCLKAEQLLEAVSPEPVAPSPSQTPPVADGTGDASVQPHAAGATDINHTRLFSEVTRLQREWKESGPVPKEHNERLWNRFRQACEKVIALVKEEHARNRALKEALVVEAEALAGSEEWEQAAQKIIDIRAQWKTIPPAARHDEQALWTRLQNAGNTFFDRRRKHFDEKKALTLQQIGVREGLCAEMELLVRVAGKGHLLKMAKPASSAEALKTGIAMRNEIDVEGDAKKTADNIKKRAFLIMDKWEAEIPGGGREFYQLEKRFYDAVDILRSR